MLLRCHYFFCLIHAIMKYSIICKFNISQYVFIRIIKKHLNLLVDNDLINNVYYNDFLISKFLENKLVEYISFIYAVSKTLPQYNTYKRYIRSVDEKPNNDNLYSKPHNSKLGAYGLVVMTLPSHGRGRRFKSG